jgi:dual-specificity kinase
MATTRHALDSSRLKDVLEPASKRRRAGPDWSDFYKNGLPKEVIVIDDSPEPTPRAMNGHVNHASADSSGAVMPNKKRKRDNAEAIHQNGHATSASYHGTPSSRSYHNTVYSPPSASSMRTHVDNSASLQVGQKRKRTRNQLANGTHQREVQASSRSYIDYQTPPRPTRKVPEVAVRVVRDVCFLGIRIAL